MNTSMLRKMILLASAVMTLAGLPAANAADAAAYPTRPIRFIVPYVSGGGGDIVARTAAVKMSERFGVSVIVDNRAGAGGSLGTELVAKASPDGYTLLLGNVGPLAINVALYKTLPYNPLTDLAPVSMLAVYPNVLVIHPGVPAQSLGEFVTLVKSRPGTFSYGSAGTGSSTHLAAELLKSMAGLNMMHVPYKGGAQAIVDVMAGQVQMYFSSTLGALPHVKSGKLRALAVTSATRPRAAPDLPTIAESGFPGYEAVNWLGLLVPARTPAPIVSRLNGEIVRIFGLPEVEERLSSQGGEAKANSPAEFAAYIRAEIRKWSEVVRVSGAKPE